MPQHAAKGRAQQPRHVLPAPAQRPPVTAAPDPPVSKRQNMVTAACIACRKQKTKVTFGNDFLDVFYTLDGDC